MTIPFKPLNVPRDAAQMPEFVDRMQQALSRAVQSAIANEQFQVLTAAPTTTKAGMLVYADGTNWNPGNGEGLYVRNAANNAWVTAFLPAIIDCGGA